MGILSSQVGYALRGSLVSRYHNRTTIVQDTVGRHSTVVAWLCWALSDGAPSTALVMAAVTHDLPESVLSDISAPVKHLLKGATDMLEDRVHEKLVLMDFGKMLSDNEAAVLKMADKLEGLLFSAHEVKGLGNRRMLGVMKKYDLYVNSLINEAMEPLKSRAREVLNAIYLYFDQPHDEEDLCGL